MTTHYAHLSAHETATWYDYSATGYRFRKECRARLAEVAREKGYNKVEITDAEGYVAECYAVDWEKP
jgi:hypothetical protein